MRSHLLPYLVLSLLLSSSIAQAKRTAFVGCPVVRDMAEPDRPCWLIEYKGELYYLDLQSDTVPPVTFYPPQLHHKALFEGEILQGPRVCGGLPTKDFKISPLPEIAPECNTILPQAGIAPPPQPKLSAPFAPGMRAAVRPTGKGFIYDFPKPPVPQQPYQAKSFRIDFAFGDDFLHLPEGITASQAVGYLEAIRGSAITVDVHRDRVVLEDGRVMEEDMVVARRRADRLRSVLAEWGVPKEKIRTRLSGKAVSGARYLDLVVTP